jgi:hypothetical protein
LVGDWTLVGTTVMNPAPGTQENQKVPMVVVPVLLSVMSYSNVPAIGCVSVKVAVAIKGAALAVPTKQTTAKQIAATVALTQKLFLISFCICSPTIGRVRYCGDGFNLTSLYSRTKTNDYCENNPQ